MDKQLQRNAYHEAGHILIGYLFGYKCDKVQLNVDADGNAMSSFDYGPDLLLIAALTNYKDDPTIFDELDKAIKNRSFIVANRIANILLAGSVTETMFLNDFKTGGEVALEISGPDLMRSDQVHHFFTRWKQGHDPNYLQNTIAEQFDFYVLPEFMAALHKLAEEILAQEDYTLNQEQIEAILEQTGFFTCIAQFQ